MDSMDMDKKSLRHTTIARRKQVPADERTLAGDRLAVAAEPLLAGLRPGTTVAAYVSMGSEIPMTPLLRRLLATGCRVLVPRLGRGLDVGWGELPSLDELHDMTGDVANGRSSRPQEPDGETLGMDALAEASLVILPALLADATGTRLGRGGGWYDRALEHRAPDATVAAVCWQWEVVDRPLPREAHDVPVNAILTPEGLRRLG
ncbi:5-formyltetrahydrofolate cyclo-ligase [Bifidobacterium amazonense]|uniref:5-formyltetrahydrofolate cyclo-ligase n=1 Tax=Bifidobacterium amazonense TaxID=2809027 RepID=A0ABS9VWA9_9BIFI|nr:5-formyltetrahydrofolate cyclo-ligase [Bifidobacterium amazonense]MCH9276206.1 5-formyltetrahydrofolate cyclo-ligase [Bifidobacterium amazonense]